MILYKALARLLDYPEPELRTHLDELRQAVMADPSVTQVERKVIADFVDQIAGKSLLELEQDYVQTFDMTPEHSLHLTHHLFGDDRGRGPALVDLGEHYKGMGLAAREGELPDYLPLILEYVSTLDNMAARVFLADAAKVLTVVATNLEKSGSHFAPLLRLVEGRGNLVEMAS